MKSEDSLGVCQIDEGRRVFWAKRGVCVKLKDETAWGFGVL